MAWKLILKFPSGKSDERKKLKERRCMHFHCKLVIFIHFFPHFGQNKNRLLQHSFLILYEECKMRIRNGALSSNPQWCNVTFNRTNSCADEHVWIYLCVFIIKNGTRSLSLSLSLPLYFSQCIFYKHEMCVIFKSGFSRFVYKNLWKFIWCVCLPFFTVPLTAMWNITRGHTQMSPYTTI